MNYINGRNYFTDEHRNLYLINEGSEDIFFCSNIKKYSQSLSALPVGKLEASYKVNESYEDLFIEEVV